MDHDIYISHTNAMDAVAFLQKAGYEYHRTQVVTRASLGDKPWLQSKGIGPNFIPDEHAAPVNSRYLEEGVNDVLDLHWRIEYREAHLMGVDEHTHSQSTIFGY